MRADARSLKAVKPRVVVFDLDGTLLRGRTVCEVLADGLGKRERMAVLETVRNHDDVLASRAEMASWYRGVPRTQLLAHLEDATLAPGAVEGIELLQRSGAVCAIASVTWSFAVEWFAARLAIRHTLATAFDQGGQIHHVWPRDKRTWVTSLGERLAVAHNDIVTVGDSWRDVDMFDAGARAFYVGDDGDGLPSHVTVVPGAGILHVARWALDS